MTAPEDSHGPYQIDRTAFTHHLPALSASAADTIEFEGNIRINTCNLTVEGSTTPTITLLQVSHSLLATAGNVAGITRLRVSVDSCLISPKGGWEVKTLFTGNNVTSEGNPGNTDGTASHVDLRIFTEASGSPPHKPSQHLDISSRKSFFIPSGNTAGSRNHYVGYYASGTATPGSVRGSMQYAIIYD